MDVSNYSVENKLGFREIVLNYLRKIMDLNLKIVGEDYSVIYFKTYRNAVLGLADVLIPFYDTRMNKVYSGYEKDYEDLINKTCVKGRVENVTLYLTGGRKIHRELFRELNLLLKRNDYLKESVYGEGGEEVVEVEDEK